MLQKYTWLGTDFNLNSERGGIRWRIEAVGWAPVKPMRGSRIKLVGKAQGSSSKSKEDGELISTRVLRFSLLAVKNRSICGSAKGRRSGKAVCTLGQSTETFSQSRVPFVPGAPRNSIAFK